MRIYENLCYGAAALDLYLPDTEDFDLFLYFHGGGIVEGDKLEAGTPSISEYLSERGIGFASANYRMYPEAKYPDFLEDARDAVAWIKNNISKYGKCKKLFVGGSSAGGYISMMLCFNPELLAGRGMSANDLSGFIHDAGQPTAHFNVLKELGIDPRRVIVDEHSPLYYVGLADSYPPMLFIVSDGDIPARYEQTLLMKATLDGFGHKNTELKLMHGTHVSYLKEYDAEGNNVFATVVADFINRAE